MVATIQSPSHIPVLLDEAIQGLNIQSDGIYVDGTFGRGGHSSQVLERLGDEGRLYALDQDEAAIKSAQARFSGDARFSIAHESFAHLEHWSLSNCIQGNVDGLLLDIGVSSPQLDVAERGFSFQSNGPLDMRMNQSVGVSAADWIQSVDETDLANVIYQYGEERQSRRIARRIVEARVETPIQTTHQLANIVASAVRSKDKQKHPATRTFQAIRIHINKELDALKAALSASIALLKPGGRLVVISFHSLEDRIVKQFMRKEASTVNPDLNLPRGLPLPAGVETVQTLKLIGKAIKPSEEELSRNPRARSAVLRIAERLPV